MKTIITLAFVAFSYVGFAQLIDNFGKIITHEIILNKQDDGTYTGAVEWTTGGIDSLQRFVINDLSIKAPVMVRIVSKAPNYNIDLTFHKNNWDSEEAKISTNGKKFVDKIFRTKNLLGLGVSSEVAGIPYLISVRVGLQFPSTQSIIRVTDDKEEYTKHLRGLGIQGDPFGGNSTPNTSQSTVATTGSSDENNTLLYIIIGLLSIIAILFGIFLFKKKPRSNALLLMLCFGFSQLMMSQSTTPSNVPMADQSDVFLDYANNNVANQVPVTYDDPGLIPAMDRDAYVSYDGGKTYALIRLRPNQGAIELSPEDAAEVNRQMQEATDDFNRDFRDNMPGEDTEGDQRTLPVDRTAEELEQLRRQVRRLQAAVERLEAENEDGDDDETENNPGNEILIYCEVRDECFNCMNKHLQDFTTHYAYYIHLQNYYFFKSTVLNDYITWGNSMSSLPGGGGIGWTSTLLHKVRPAMKKMKKAYDSRFDDYIASMEKDLSNIKNCASSMQLASSGTYEAQVAQLIQALKAARISK
ncbi:GumC domain-containing protein [Winogradskyella thalassocola]|uniref:Uncharacterized protein n=1 Tax=Winogradskyella thalassocola TaxID=262004 RepID=A0A1G8BKG7_9FLAO|nr:hypothetical protein [Winogradskyella thalassocola]SDH33722.1 hypothetical protein SAMN04489796_102354 [Winogradskyella thalassocola]